MLNQGQTADMVQMTTEVFSHVEISQITTKNFKTSSMIVLVSEDIVLNEVLNDECSACEPGFKLFINSVFLCLFA